MKSRRRPFVRIIRAGAILVAATTLAHCEQEEVITNPPPPGDTVVTDTPRVFGNPAPDAWETGPEDTGDEDGVGPEQSNPPVDPRQ